MHGYRALVGAALLIGGAANPIPALAEEPPTFADRTDREEGGDAERSLGVLFDPLSAASGVFGGEADFVLGAHLVASAEAALYSGLYGGLYGGDRPPALALGGGLLVYPRGAFRGPYVEPRVVYAHPLAEGFAHVDLSREAFGAGATLGWQWTWDYGFTLRLGAGAIYFVQDGAGAADARAIRGAQLVLDGSLGWTF
jgi:hypothetical protein